MITREQAINNLQEYVRLTTSATNEQIKNFWCLENVFKYLNNLPQLSDDVEEALENLYKLHVEDVQRDYHIQLAQILEQHIQAQETKIDRIQYQLEIAWEQITEYENKLNAIRELIEQYENTPLPTDKLNEWKKIATFNRIYQLLKED